MDYREYAPPPGLAGAVESIWTLAGCDSANDAPQPVLPDGRPELIIHLGGPFEIVDPSGRVERQAPSLFGGQLDTQLVLRPTGPVAIVGIRFHPFGAAGLFDIPQHELVGPPRDLGAVHPALQRELRPVQQSAGDLRAAARAVEHVLLARIDRMRIDARVRAAVLEIKQSGGNVSIERAAAAAGMTRRHLERRFLDDVGVTPKRLARILRFQRALGVLERVDSRRRGVETAYTCGYADQAHFIRDFRRLAGCSPSHHLLRQGELTSFFVNSDA